MRVSSIFKYLKLEGVFSVLYFSITTSPFCKVGGYTNLKIYVPFHIRLYLSIIIIINTCIS